MKPSWTLGPERVRTSELSPGHLDLPGAPLALQVVSADHTDGLPTAIDGLCNVLHDGPTYGGHTQIWALFK